jgi:hypothetical protein
MKNLRIIRTIEIGGVKYAAGDLVPNVDNGIAARLVVDGLAKEEPPESKIILVPDITTAAQTKAPSKKKDPAPLAGAAE